MLKKEEEHLVTQNIQTAVSESNAFRFVMAEEYLSTLAGAKEIYNG